MMSGSFWNIDYYCYCRWHVPCCVVRCIFSTIALLLHITYDGGDVLFFSPEGVRELLLRVSPFRFFC